MNGSSPAAAPANGDYAAVRFSTIDYAPRQRLEALRETYGRTLQKVDIEPLSTEPLHVEATLRRMPGLGMMSCRRSAATYHRRREFIDHDDVGVTVGLTSDYEAYQRGRTLAMKRGEAIVMTGSEPAFLRVPQYGEYISIRLPVRAMAPRIADLDAAYGTAIPADNPALQLLIRYIGILEEMDGFATPDVRLHAVAYVHDLVTLAIGATQDAAESARSRGAGAALLRVIKKDIANHLGQTDLSLARVATRHRVAPRHIQRLFESEGTTFTEYLLTQRLALVHRVLSDPRRAGLKISAVAFDAGFADQSYFNRAFRRRYGIAPSDLRAETAARP